MDEKFNKKIIEDLEKSGFGSEMRAIRVFLSRKWGCTGNFSYFDKDAQISREGDLHASRRKMKKLSSLSSAIFWFHIAGEVKKSDNPWIVFKEQQRRNRVIDAYQNLTFFKHLPYSHVNLVEPLTEHSLLTKVEWEGYGIHESFKKPDRSSRWYSSFVSSCKAAEHILESYSLGEKTDKEISKDVFKKSPYFVLVKPVVVLDGPLLSAEITSTGKISIKEIDAAPFEFHFKTINYDRRSYRIDLVSLSALAKYIEKSEKRQDTIFNAILKNAGLIP